MMIKESERVWLQRLLTNESPWEKDIKKRSKRKKEEREKEKNERIINKHTTNAMAKPSYRMVDRCGWDGPDDGTNGVLRLLLLSLFGRLFCYIAVLVLAADEWYNIATQSCQSSVDSFTSKQVDALFDAILTQHFSTWSSFGVTLILFLSLTRSLESFCIIKVWNYKIEIFPSFCGLCVLDQSDFSGISAFFK